MRTTIEITDRQRAELLRRAAERGEKGFSRIVQEAIDHYLAADEEREARVKRALAIRLSPQAGDHMRRTVRALREGPWRTGA